MTAKTRELFRKSNYSARLQQLAGTVLEVGCGRGRDFPEFGLDASVVASDRSFRKARNAKSTNMLILKPNIQIVVADMEALPFPASSFDAIVSSFVFCSVANINVAVDELARVAKPGAILVGIEHVRSLVRPIGYVQDLLSPIYAILSSNCHLNRNPLIPLQSHNFKLLELHYSKHISPWLFFVAKLG